ncbi:hypothetical protein ACTACL_21470 [Pseudomonas syringae]|uniref:hypothetical protein n=1 Tax=Pseudomonas syringae TaxID=317 RepID=UPI003F7AC572
MSVRVAAFIQQLPGVYTLRIPNSATLTVEFYVNYQKDHAEIVWSEAIPDLDISQFSNWFGAGFAKSEIKKGISTVSD